MGRERMVLQPLTPEEPDRVLLKEHDELRNKASKLSDALVKEDYTKVAEIVNWFHQPLSGLTSDNAEFNNVDKPLGEHAENTEEKIVFPYIVKRHRETSKK